MGERDWVRKSTFDGRVISEASIDLPVARVECARRVFGPSSQTRFTADRHAVFLASASTIEEHTVEFDDGLRFEAKTARVPTALVYPRGRNVHVTTRGEGVIEYVGVFFASGALEQAARKCGARALELRPIALSLDVDLLRIGRQIRREQQSRAAGRVLMLEALCLELMAFLLRRHVGDPHPLDAHPKSLEPPDPRLARARDFIHANLHRPLSLSEIARVASMSPYHFGRSFRRAFNRPPYRYLMEQRLEQAKLLLREGTMRLTEISVECGFNDHSHFGQVFRRETGMSPGEYRKHS